MLGRREGCGRLLWIRRPRAQRLAHSLLLGWLWATTHVPPSTDFAGATTLPLFTFHVRATLLLQIYLLMLILLVFCLRDYSCRFNTVTSETGSATVWIGRFFILKTHESSSRQAIAAKALKDWSTPTSPTWKIFHIHNDAS